MRTQPGRIPEYRRKNPLLLQSYGGQQAFYDYLERKDTPWKYQPLADAMLKIHDEDEENADYGRVRMYQALRYQKEIGKLDGIKIPCSSCRSVIEQFNRAYPGIVVNVYWK